VLDIITAPGLLLLGYGIALARPLARQLRGHQLPAGALGPAAPTGSQRELACTQRAKSDHADCSARR
jgi:hypothetical protein